MTIGLFHQVGHNPNWNQESFVQDGCGDGLILSPVHQARTNIEKLNVKVRKASLFDPQYYLPNSQKAKLGTYNFFPETLSGGFSTKGFASLALESAKACLQFQINMQFGKLVIPARYFDQMYPDYAEKQDAYTVNAFLTAAKLLGTKKPMLLTLPLTSHMLEHEKYRTDILNWVTSYPEISGVYVFAVNERETKQPTSQKFLGSYLSFLQELRNVELELLVGYSNTESLLLALIQDISLTMGSFENTRMFSIDKFVVSSEERRGPKARIYIPALLNWIQIDQAKQIKKDAPAIWKQIYRETDYANEALSATVEPTFNQPALYKHYFICFAEQIEALSGLSSQERFEMISAWIGSAISFHGKIRKAGIEIERHGNHEHLAIWQTTIDEFADLYL